MLEKQMEEAVANCPDLFIEPGLELIRREYVINGRRPDVLFNDPLDRHLLVEVQSERLDEEHGMTPFWFRSTTVGVISGSMATFVLIEELLVLGNDSIGYKQ